MQVFSNIVLQHKLSSAQTRTFEMGCVQAKEEKAAKEVKATVESTEKSAASSVKAVEKETASVVTAEEKETASAVTAVENEVVKKVEHEAAEVAEEVVEEVVEEVERAATQITTVLTGSKKEEKPWYERLLSCDASSCCSQTPFDDNMLTSMVTDIRDRMDRSPLGIEFEIGAVSIHPMAGRIEVDGIKVFNPKGCLLLLKVIFYFSRPFLIGKYL